eukprot:COSAG01_NODE_9181_length_2528_cov_14.104981_2_plen_83_part_00
MITILSNNTTVSQILAAHGCQTTAYRFATWSTHCLLFTSFAFPLGLLRFGSSSSPLQLRLNIHCSMIIIHILVLFDEIGSSF